MRYTEEDLRKIIENVSVLDYFQHLAKQGKVNFERKSGRDYYFRTDENKFSVNETGFYDFKTGEGGKLIKAIMTLENKSWKEAMDFLKDFSNTYIPPEIIVDKTSDETNWKDGYGGNLHKHSIMLSQSYLGSEDNPNLPLKEVEIYETSAPILSSIFRVFTYRKDFDYSNPAHLNKTINVYADDKLILTKTYSQEEVEKTEGIILELKL